MDFMKNLQAAQEQFAKMKNEMDEKEYEGSSGGGMVKIVISGCMDMKNLSIDESLLDKKNASMISDLVMAAFNDAKTKCQSDSAQKLKGLTDGKFF